MGWRGETSSLLQYDNISTAERTVRLHRPSTPHWMTMNTASTVNVAGGLEAHLNAGDPTQSESAASRSSNRTLNRVDHENVDSTPQRPLRSALGA